MNIKQIVRPRKMKILRSGVVFAMDMVISSVISLLALLFVRVQIPGTMVLIRVVFAQVFGVAIFASILAFFLTKTYRHVIRHTNMQDVLWLIHGVLVKELIIILVSFIWWESLSIFIIHFWTFIILDFLATSVALVGVRAFLVTAYTALIVSAESSSKEKLLVYSIGQRAYGLIAIMNQSKRYRIAGFLNYEKGSRGQQILGHKVWPMNSIQDLEDAVEKTGARLILFPTLADFRREADRIIPYCNSHDIKLLLSPNIDNAHQNGTELKLGLREISIEDILGRDEITIDMHQVSDAFRGRCVMVTGAAGSIGSEICRQLAGVGVSRLVMFDNAETPLHNLMLEMEEKFGANVNEGTTIEFCPIIGDVRLRPRLEMCFERFHPEVVFHAAAYKHVPMMESNPCEAVYVNVVGTRNVADCCVKYKVSNMIMISTDKAVNPTNVMGATKRAAEMYVQSLGHRIVSGKLDSVTKFTTTRFGNVLGSNGSVIPRFREQIKKGGPLTVTSKEITRYFMSIPEATRLVLEAATMGRGCDIFIFDMGSPVKIYEMAKKMVELAGYTPEVDIQIDITGLRPGEKITEELLKDAEKTQATKNEKIFITNAREVDYDEVNRAIDELRVLAAEKMDLTGTVKRLKELVPEYKSQNSIYEALDK